MEKKVSVLRICLNHDRPIESESLIYLNKCSRSRSTLVSCAIREFVEKYQLSELSSEELKKFLRSYMDFVNGTDKPDANSRLQKSLQLIGTDGKCEIHRDFSANQTTTLSIPEDPIPSPIDMHDTGRCAPVEAEERNLSTASREKMNNVLGMFRSQK